MVEPDHHLDTLVLCGFLFVLVNLTAAMKRDSSYGYTYQNSSPRKTCISSNNNRCINRHHSAVQVF